MWGADLAVMERDALHMRAERPFEFTDMKRGHGVENIITFLKKHGGL